MGKNLILATKKYVLFLGDIIILYFSLWLTLIIRYQQEYAPSLFKQHFWPFSFVFVIWLAFFYIDDLYELAHVQGKAGILSRLLRSLTLGIIFAVFFFYLGQDRLFNLKPQTILLINALIAGLAIYAWHLFFNLLSKSSKISNNLMIIGFNPLANEIIDKIYKKPQLGYQIKVIILESNETPPNISDELKEIIIQDNYLNLKNICLDKKIDIIISIIHPRKNANLSDGLFKCLPLKIDFFDIATFYEKITGKIPVTTIEQTWFLENLTEGNKRIYEELKRFFDIIFSLILLILFLPFIPIFAAAIRINDRGPTFFTQKRVGKDGRIFTAIKLRTMIIEAEKKGPQWAIKNDPRVTTLGKFLRKTRIDEIPQLINVLKGEMSLIGPRPERPEFIDQLSKYLPFYKERLLIKPGLTGWAQVVGPAYGGSEKETLEKLQYDLFYIKNRSLTLDLSIILKTIRTVLSIKGQ